MCCGIQTKDKLKAADDEEKKNMNNMMSCPVSDSLKNSRRNSVQINPKSVDIPAWENHT